METVLIVEPSGTSWVLSYSWSQLEVARDRGRRSWWLVAVIIPAMLARAKVDMGAPGEVQGPQAMSRLSSSTTQPTKCCFHAWKVPCYPGIPQESCIEARLQ